MPELVPNRDNWHQFADEREPPLSDAEFRTWRRMAQAVRQHDSLMTELITKTELERTDSGAGWGGFVNRVVAQRRLRRAEIQWWKEKSGG